MLNIIKSTTKNKPHVYIICGDSGVGKTTLASTFPEPLLLTMEGENPSQEGLSCIKIQGYKHMLDTLEELHKSDHKYRTLVIDSITTLDLVISLNLAKQYGGTLSSILGGFGSGYDKVKDLHGEFFDACDKIRKDKNKNIVFISHIKIKDQKTVDHPEYSKYALELHDKTSQVYVKRADCIGMLRNKLAFKSSESNGKKAVDTGDKELSICNIAGSYDVAKNRFQLKNNLIIKEGVFPEELKPFVV